MTAHAPTIDSCELARVHDRTLPPQARDHERRIRRLERVSIRHAVLLGVAATAGSLLGGGLLTWLFKLLG